MNNPIVLKSISILAFIISALFTIVLMTSGTVGIFSWILTVGMAVILETCKCGFFYEALSNTKLLAPIRALLAVIALLLVVSSILASASYVQNQANKTKNIQTKDSSQYKQLEAGKAVQGDLYNVKKKEIDDLKALQEKQQAEGEKIINSMPKNYIDRKNQQRADTIAQIAKTQDIINTKSNELSGLGESIKTPIDTTNLKLNSDNGYTAMFKTMTDMINSSPDYKDNPVTPEQLEMWFFIGLGIIFEMVAILTAYLSQLKSQSMGITANNNIYNDTSIGFRPQLVTATSKDSDSIKSNRVIGFQKPETLTVGSVEGDNMNYSQLPELKVVEPLTYTSVEEGFNRSDVIKYLEYMYDNQKRLGISQGMRTIAKNINIHEELARKIKGHLETLKIIKSEDLSTKILCSKHEALSRI